MGGNGSNRGGSGEIVIRSYSAGDLEAIVRMYLRQGLGYAMPDFESPTFIVRAILEDDAGPAMGMFLRRTAEAFMVLDPGRVRKRHQIGRFLALHREVEIAGRREGLESVHSWVSPGTGNFGRLLMRVGWRKHLWPSYLYGDGAGTE